MRSFAVIFVLFLGMACTSAPNLEQVQKLNGYWQIATVTFANGQQKEYSLSTTVDYIKISNNKGFKKKVQPKWDGSFNTSNDAEIFTVEQRKENLFLHYKNNLSQWEEQLVNISDSSYTVINEEKISYTYQRYMPITITQE